MSFISLSQAHQQWQELTEGIDKNDSPALAESWNDYTDSLAKDGELCALQYHYAPAFDETMPGEGSRWDALADDREFILDRMGLSLVAVFVPFSQSRNKAEKNPSLNWRVTLRHNGRDVLTCDYSQGCAHCPAYNNPTLFVSGKRDEYTTQKRIAAECETGCVTSRGDNRTSTFTNNGGKIAPPDLVDVFYSLLQDGRAIDCRDFADWCAELGFDEDSRAAESMYHACLETGLKLRATFGDKTMRELHELFEGM